MVGVLRSLGVMLERKDSRRQCRVLLVISNLEYGGAQRQVIELANNLDRDAFDVHICSLSDYVPLAADLKNRDGHFHIIKKSGKFDLTVVTRLARLLSSLRIDIVQGYLFDAVIATRVAGRLARTPVIIGAERNSNYQLDPRHLAAYWLTRRWVNLIIANSHTGAEFNQKMLGYDRTMYRVVHNGVDIDTFCPHDRATVRRELGLPEHGHVIGMFASFKQQKNHALFFTAATYVLQRFPDTRLLLVGDELYAGMHGSDEYKAEVHNLIDTLGIREKCLFLGSQTDVARLYSACDVTVLPSLFEGMPNTVLESMSCAVPVVATDVSDNALLVLDGRTGFIVPLGDAECMAERLCRVMSNNDLCLTMGRQAREWVTQEFSTLRLATKTAEVYHSALGAVREAARLS